MNTDNEKPKKDAADFSPYEVSAEGSLGLLALGAEGIRAWRKKKIEEKAKSIIKSKDE